MIPRRTGAEHHDRPSERRSRLTNMFRSRSLRACLVILILLPLAACRREKTANAPGITEIKFWNGFTGPDGKTMERMVSQFQKENPAIRVRMQIIPWAQYY